MRSCSKLPTENSNRHPTPAEPAAQIRLAGGRWRTTLAPMKLLPVLLCALLLFAGVAMAQSDSAAPKPLKVLLVGNSQCPTIIKNHLIENLAASDKSGRPITIGSCVKGGASLKSHWDAGTEPGTARAIIAGGGWDYVVLQDIYFVAEAEFQPYARLFHQLIKESGAQTLLFGTASILSDYPKGFERQHRMHLAMGKELGVPIVDASQAYFRYFGENPSTGAEGESVCEGSRASGAARFVSLFVHDLQRAHGPHACRAGRARKHPGRGSEGIAGDGLGAGSGDRGGAEEVGTSAEAASLSIPKGCQLVAGG